ncbi:MAG: hypothetical protein HY261_03015 [Chloroflexi bacterium]|nr:hypothetical protein [Chloroflexota bacterium]
MPQPVRLVKPLPIRPVAKRPKAAAKPPARVLPTVSPSLTDHVSRIQALEASMREARSAQESQFLQMMKFVVLRHLSLMAILAEGRTPERIAAEIRKGVEDGARKIADGKTLGEVKELDMTLQQQLRQVVLAFKS